MHKAPRLSRPRLRNYHVGEIIEKLLPVKVNLSGVLQHATKVVHNSVPFSTRYRLAISLGTAHDYMRLRENIFVLSSVITSMPKLKATLEYVFIIYVSHACYSSNCYQHEYSDIRAAAQNPSVTHSTDTHYKYRLYMTQTLHRIMAA